MDRLEALRNLDMYPKAKEEFRVRTMQGGLSTLVAAVVALALVRTEMRHALKIQTHDRLFVNASHGAGLQVRFELEFPRANCDLLSLDANDEGGQPLEAVQHVTKTRLGPDGKRLPPRKAPPEKAVVGGTATAEDHLEDGPKQGDPNCGDCYGAQDDEHPCCSTCEEVQAAYRRHGWTFHAETVEQCHSGPGAVQALDADKNEGCEIKGTIDLPAVSGNFHVAPGRHLKAANAFQGLDVVLLTFEQFNVSHVIKRIAFGPGDADDVDNVRDDAKKYGRRRNWRYRRPPPLAVDLTSQLDGQRRTLTDGYGMHQYYLKVVPTMYKFLDGSQRELWQYSVTEHVRHVAPGSGRGLPGVFFFYEVSPLVAEFVERREGWRALLTGLAAIVGGVHATAALVDRAVGALMERRKGGARLVN